MKIKCIFIIDLPSHNSEESLFYNFLSVVTDDISQLKCLLAKIGGPVTSMSTNDIIMIAVAGSAMYNLNTPESDVDYLVIYRIPTQVREKRSKIWLIIDTSGTKTDSLLKYHAPLSSNIWKYYDTMISILIKHESCGLVCSRFPKPPKFPGLWNFGSRPLLKNA